MSRPGALSMPQIPAFETPPRGVLRSAIQGISNWRAKGIITPINLPLLRARSTKRSNSSCCALAYRIQNAASSVSPTTKKKSACFIEDAPSPGDAPRGNARLDGDAFPQPLPIPLQPDSRAAQQQQTSKGLALAR